MSDQEIVGRLDTLIAILRLANREAIEEARERVLTDDTNKAVLGEATSWVPAGKLKKAAMEKAKQSQPTVERRIAELVAQGFLEKQGGGGSVSYRSTGLI